MQRAGQGPLNRRVLIVDNTLAGATSAAARSVRALVAELDARAIQVVDQPQAGVDRALPWFGKSEPGEQLPAP